MSGLTGYQGSGPTPILIAILAQHPLDTTLPSSTLAEKLFDNNLLPYAKTHWAYNGITCNCQNLAEAMVASWAYLKTATGRGDMPQASQENCSTQGKSVITINRPVLGGVAKGNIRLQSTGQPDGRCLFANHTVCQIGSEYFDLTYMRRTKDKADCILRDLKTKIGDAIWVVENAPGRLLYVRDAQTTTAGFGDCYHELNGRGWLTAQDWKSKTSRMGHTRSRDLESMDAALKALEARGWVAFLALKTAFSTWVKHNPDEAKTRDADHCVRDMASFLGINLMQLGVKII